MFRSALASFLVCLLGVLPARGGQFRFGVPDLVESGAAGTGTILLAAPAATAAWNASSDSAWLTLETTSGSGNARLQYSFGANPDRKPRTATITAGDTTVAITQAGKAYTRIQSPITLVTEGLVTPSSYGLAVDAEGNAYISDVGDKTIKKWTAATGTLSTLIASGLESSAGLAVGPTGEIAFADFEGHQIGLWSPGTRTVTTLLAGEEMWPIDVAFARDGQVLFADLGAHHEIRCVNPVGGSVAVVYEWVGWPQGVAVDICGDLYLADQNGNNWGVIWYSPSTAADSPLVYSSDSICIYGVGVDAVGNVYFTQSYSSGGGNVCRRKANSDVIESLAGWLDSHPAMAVDARGNVFITDCGRKRLQTIPNSWVDPTPQEIGAGAGTAVLPPVLPEATKLSGPYAPVSDQPWLSVTGVAGGVICYTFSENRTGADRVAHLAVLGQSIRIRQAAGVVTLGARATLAGAEAAAGSVLVDAASDGTHWTAESRDGWIHLAQTSGTGDAMLRFSCDANTHQSPRDGVIVIGGTEFVVTQAGAAYVPVTQGIKLPIAGLGNPSGLAADADGNLVIADSQNNRLVKWWARTGTVTTLVEAGIDGPAGVAIDAAGNVVFADSRNNAVKRRIAATGQVETLVGDGLSRPDGVAITPEGDVLIADTGHDAIKRWSAVDGAVSVLVDSGLNGPAGVAVDRLGNVSIGDRLNDATKRWLNADDTVTILEDRGGYGVAADGCGNVFLSAGDKLCRWSATSGTSATLTTLAPELLGLVAVDGRGNVYFSATTERAIYVLPNAYVDTTPRLAGSSEPNASFVPVLALAPILTGALAPTSDQPWLVIEKVEEGRIFYRAGYNRTDAPRTGHLTVLGKTIPVVQQTLDSWTYDAFKQWHFTPAECADPAVSGPEADPSGRGVSNLLAYGLGLDPRNPDLGGLPRATVVDGVYRLTGWETGTPQGETLNGVPQLTFRKCSAAPGLVYVVEASSDLVHWEATPTLADWSVLDSMYVEETYRDLNGAGAARRFLRLRVTNP